MVDRYYKDLEIITGFGISSTHFKNSYTETQTDNEATRLVIHFPTVYSNYYVKLLDVIYTGSDLLSHLDTYALGTELVDGEEHYTFKLPRYMTYGPYILMQFRVQFTGDAIENVQEVVDPTVLTLRFKPSLKRTGFSDLDTIPDSIYSEGVSLKKAAV